MESTNIFVVYPAGIDLNSYNLGRAQGRLEAQQETQPWTFDFEEKEKRMNEKIKDATQKNTEKIAGLDFTCEISSEEEETKNNRKQETQGVIDKLIQERCKKILEKNKKKLRKIMKTYCKKEDPIFFIDWEPIINKVLEVNESLMKEDAVFTEMKMRENQLRSWRSRTLLMFESRSEQRSKCIETIFVNFKEQVKAAIKK